MAFDFCYALQTEEVMELSKQIKEKLKEADQFGKFPFFILLLQMLNFVGQDVIILLA